MSATELQQKTMQEEVNRLSSLLTPYIDGGERKPTVSALTYDDLDRLAAREADWEDMQRTLLNTNDIATTILCKQIHEDNRIRRDVKIATATHKQLMLSSLSIAYSRRKELSFRLEGGI